MANTNSKVLLIHPYDKTTRFLDRIKNALQLEFGDFVHYYSVKPNCVSHEQCLERISSHSSEGLIIFLGHGRSDKLYGSQGDLFESAQFVSTEVIQTNPEDYYCNDNFINYSNVSVFNGKKVFCLSCNSSGSIANAAIDNGASVFVGFGNIPTSINEFKETGNRINRDLVKDFKTELNYIIKKTLILGIRKEWSFEYMLDVLNFITTQRISNILIHSKKNKERHLLTDYLYFFKKEARIFGKGKIKMIA